MPVETPVEGVFGKTEPSGEEFPGPGVPRGQRLRLKLSRDFPRSGSAWRPTAIRLPRSADSRLADRPAVAAQERGEARVLPGSRILCLGREILFGSGLALGGGWWICSRLPVRG